MLGNAFSMAVLTTVGFYMLFEKLPRNARKLIIKYSLISDFASMVLTYWMFGGTVTALIAGAMVDIFISVMLYIANHPEEFLWLEDITRQVKELANAARAKLSEMSVEYRVKRQAASGVPTASA